MMMSALVTYCASTQKQQSICGHITQLGDIILILSCVISKEAENILLKTHDPYNTREPGKP